MFFSSVFFFTLRLKQINIKWYFKRAKDKLKNIAFITSERKIIINSDFIKSKLLESHIQLTMACLFTVEMTYDFQIQIHKSNIKRPITKYDCVEHTGITSVFFLFWCL